MLYLLGHLNGMVAKNRSCSVLLNMKLLKNHDTEEVLCPREIIARKREIEFQSL